MVQNFLSQSIGAAGNVISGLIGRKSGSAQAAAQLQYENQLKLQREAQQYNTYAYQHRYQWEMEDKAAAGLNPLYGLSSPSAPSISAGAAGMPDMVGEANNKRQMAMQGAQLMQSASALYYDNQLKEAETQNKRMENNLIAWEGVNRQLDAMYKKKELDNYDKKFIAELQKIKAEIAESLSGAVKNSAEAGSAQAMQKKIQEETKGIASSNEKLKKLAELYKNNPELAKILLGAQEGGNGNIGQILGIMAGAGATNDGRGRTNDASYIRKKVKAIIKQNEEARKHRPTSVRGLY